jgi:hypothetical protein
MNWRFSKRNFLTKRSELYNGMSAEEYLRCAYERGERILRMLDANYV